jgi:hypothetical protein
MKLTIDFGDLFSNGEHGKGAALSMIVESLGVQARDEERRGLFFTAAHRFEMQAKVAQAGNMATTYNNARESAVRCLTTAHARADAHLDLDGE